MKSIINGNIYIDNMFIDNHVILFDKNIKGIYKQLEYEQLKLEMKESNLEIEEIDGGGTYVVPGFIDVHIHGYKGVDVMDGTAESLKSLSKGITENGVTAYLATTMTMEIGLIEKALENVKLTMKNNEGAMILGAHLEGPFINSKFKGAQPEEHIIQGNIKWLNNYKDLIKVVTIAPEIPGNMEIIEALSHVMNFSIGHSGASFDEALEAYSKGANSTTHLFNAMTGLHHREPGVVGAALTCDCYSELIADNFHVRPALYKLIAKAKGLEKILLITDCMRAGGLSEGVYDLGGHQVTMKNNQCLLPSGTIAGSVLKLKDGLKNYYESIDNELEELIPLVTLNQAKYLKVEDKMGTLDSGKYANITLLNNELDVVKTIVMGRVEYESFL